MSKKELWISTNNIGKIKEFELLLPDFEIKTLKDLPEFIEPDETGSTLKENAYIKASELSKYIDGWAIGDDTGYFFDALDGFPGVYSRRWAYPVTDFKEICKMIIDKVNISTNSDNLKMSMKSHLVLCNINKGIIYDVLGEVNGEMGDQIMDSDYTFGYDYIFKPDKYKKYSAELSLEEKLETSARKIALEKIKLILEKEGI